MNLHVEGKLAPISAIEDNRAPRNTKNIWTNGRWHEALLTLSLLLFFHKRAEHSTDSEEGDKRQPTGAVAPECVRPRGRGHSAGVRAAVERARGHEVGARAVTIQAAGQVRQCGRGGGTLVAVRPTRDDGVGWSRSNEEGREGIARSPRRQLTGDLPEVAAR